MSNTQAVVLGVNAFNKGRQAEVEAKAQQIVNSILGAQRSIKSYEKQITEEQVKLNELALDVIDQKSVIGAEFSTPLNPNQTTILNAIKKMNDARQESVSVASQAHINRITGYKSTIANLNKDIECYRKQLSELAVDVVTVEGVAGAQQ